MTTRALLSRTCYDRQPCDPTSYLLYIRISKDNGKHQKSHAQGETNQSQDGQWTEPFDRWPWPLILNYTDALNCVRRQFISPMESMCNVVYIFSRIPGMNANNFSIGCSFQFFGSRWPDEDLGRWKETWDVGEVAQCHNLGDGLNGAFSEDGKKP